MNAWHRWRGWGRLRGVVLVLGLTAAVAGCGQLFTQGSGAPTLSQLSSRVDSLDAQVGELQAALANLSPGAPTSGSPQSQAHNGIVESSLPVAQVLTGVLNVRQDPSLTGTVVGTLLQNAKVNVLGEDGNWSQITFTAAAGQHPLTGWVDSQYLGPVMDAATAGASASASTSPSTPASTAATHAAATSNAASGTSAALGGAY